MKLMFVHDTGRLGSEWVLVGVAYNSQRGSSERVRDKMILKSGTDTRGLFMSTNHTHTHTLTHTRSCI